MTQMGGERKRECKRSVRRPCFPHGRSPHASPRPLTLRPSSPTRGSYNRLLMMTETCIKPEAPQMAAIFQDLLATPPESITGGLSARGVTRELLEEYARSPLPSEELDLLRQLVLQAGR